MTSRGVINGKAGKAAALPKFTDTLRLTLLNQGVHIMPTHWLCLTVKKSLITPVLINSMYKFLEILRYTIPRSYSTQVEIELF